MKELTIEQKAKRYDEAIERAKKVLLDCTPEEQKVVEYISPELKESDDEIRESIIGFLITISSLKDGMTVSNEDFDSKVILEWAAWLEKQSFEPNWCHHRVDLSNCSEEYRKAYYDGWNNCNLQHYRMLPLNWLKSLKERVQSKQGEMSKICPTSVQDKK